MRITTTLINRYCVPYVDMTEESLNSLTLEELLDLLSDQSTKYFRMVHFGGSKEEFKQCRELMTALQLEIEARKAKGK